MATKAKTKAKDKTIIDRLDGTLLEQPVIVVNKTFLASIGLAEQVRTGFESKFDELVNDGEKARERAKKSAESLRKEAGSNFDSAAKNVKKRADEIVEKILSMSPVATSSDVDALNKKLDKVLAEVAK